MTTKAGSLPPCLRASTPEQKPRKIVQTALLARLLKLEGGTALPASGQRGALSAQSSEASVQELMLSSKAEGSRPWWSSIIPSTLAKIQGWLAPGDKKRLRDGDDAEEEPERRLVPSDKKRLRDGDDAEEESEHRLSKARREGAAMASPEQAPVAAPPTSPPTAEESLGPELRQLLVEQGFLASDTSSLAALEWPGAAAEADLVRQKARAAAEVDRILACRNAQEILGGGSREDQQKEFKRVALLLHPDKGIVQPDDNRATLAMRLALAAMQQMRRT